MMKRVFACLLALVMVLSLVPAVGLTAEAAADSGAVDYRVGYAKVDANPYWSLWEATGREIPADRANYMDADGDSIGSWHIMPLPMGGYGGNAHRLSRPELVDDNGSDLHADGKVRLSDNRPVEQGGQNDGDGIWTSCVLIQQNPNAEPILIFSVDVIGMADTYCGQAKNAIIRALKEEGISISPDRILINATHTHGSVALGESFEKEETYKLKLWGYDYDKDEKNQADLLVSFSGEELTLYLVAYRKHLYAQMAEAAKQALRDSRQENGSVTVRKGTVDVSEATGFQLNGVRHVKATLEADGQTLEYVTGSSFNVTTGGTETEAVSQSDDRMHVVEFSFSDGRAPVLMVNWRAHTTWNNKMKTQAYNNLSADFVAAMRYRLEQNGYRFLLNYGASGNLGTGDTPSTYNIGTSTSSYTTVMPGTQYGFRLAFAAMLVAKDIDDSAALRQDNLLAIQSRIDYYTDLAAKAQNAADTADAAGDEKDEEANNRWNILEWDELEKERDAFYAERDKQLALVDTYTKRTNEWTGKKAEIQTYYDALADGTKTLKMENCPQGQIRLESSWYEVQSQSADNLAYAAALAHDELAESEGSTTADTGGLQLKKTKYPWKWTGEYVDENGETKTGSFVIASQYHANSLKNRHGVLARKRISLCAFTLGDSLAFVTVPFEASDRYATGVTLATANSQNDWTKLTGSKWGTPIVMSLVNGAEGYIPNSLAYTYDAELEKAYIDGTSTTPIVSGSYEAHTAYAAAGQGEAVVAELETLLEGLPEAQTPALKTEYCHACKKYVTWQPLNDKVAEDNGNNLCSGHYYLNEAYNNVFSHLYVYLNETVCLDLNGKTMATRATIGSSRCFYLYGTLNVQDSVGGGQLKGKASQTAAGGFYDGGTVMVANQGVLNLYSGTITLEAADNCAIRDGGNVYVEDGGVFNMYGGKVVNGQVCRYGGNVSVQGGTFNLYGGEVTGGSFHASIRTKNEEGESVGTAGANLLVSGSPMGTFRYAAGYIPSGTHIMGYLYLGGEPTWHDSRISTLRATGNVQRVILNQPLHSQVKVAYKFGSNFVTNGGTYDTTLSNGGLVGSVEGTGSIAPEGRITVLQDSGSTHKGYGAVQGSELRIAASAPVRVARIGDIYYTSVADAVNAETTAESPVVLLANVSSLTLSKDLYLDLNGYDVTAVTTGSHKLTCMDSFTSDYIGADYGLIPATTACTAADNYLAVTEGEQVSFHCYALKIDMVTLKTGTVGMSYDCFIAGDRKVKQQVSEFGIAMSVYKASTAQDIFTDSQSKTHVWRGGSLWQVGPNGQALTSVAVTWIMKSESRTDSNVLSDAENQTRANIPVYGRAYMVLKDGTYILGVPESRTLQQVTQEVDGCYPTLGDSQTYVNRLYAAFRSVMESWSIPNIKSANP